MPLTINVRVLKNNKNERKMCELTYFAFNFAVGFASNRQKPVK